MKMCWLTNVIVKMLKTFVFAVIVLSALYFAVRFVWYHESERLFNATSDPNFFAALGATSALFTGLAVVASAFAVGLQAQSLENAKAELEKQQELLDKQLHIMRKQSFEISFFNLTNMHKAMANDANAHVPFNAFKDFFDDIVSREAWRAVSFAKQFNKDNAKYIDVYNSRADDIEVGVMRRVVNIWRVVIEYIVSDKLLSDEERKFYFNIFRSQLSDYECALIALHAVGRLATPGMKNVIEEYELFSGLQMVMLEDEIRDMYSPTAFGLRPC